MTYFLYFFTLISNLISKNRKRSSPIVLFLSILIMLVLWTGNNVGPDIYNYQNNYYNFGIIFNSSSLYQMLFYKPMEICCNIGLDFYQYRIVVSIVALLIIIWILNKLEINIHYYLILYLPVLFFMDGIQIRNFLATPFLLMGFYIMQKEKRYWKLQYTIAILLAGLIHSSFWIYLILLLVPQREVNKNKFIKLHGYIAVLITLFVLIFRNSLNSLISLLKIVDSTRTLGYTGVNMGTGAFIAIIMHLVAIFLTYYTYSVVKLAIRKKSSNLEDEKNLKIVRLIFWINILLCYVLPFCIVQINFYRLIRNVLVIDFVGFAIAKKYTKKKSLHSFMVVAFIGLWFIVEMKILSEPRIIIQPFFDNNIFI